MTLSIRSSAISRALPAASPIFSWFSLLLTKAQSLPAIFSAERPFSSSACSASRSFSFSASPSIWERSTSGSGSFGKWMAEGCVFSCVCIAACVCASVSDPVTEEDACSAGAASPVDSAAADVAAQTGTATANTVISIMINRSLVLIKTSLLIQKGPEKRPHGSKGTGEPSPRFHPRGSLLKRETGTIPCLPDIHNWWSARMPGQNRPGLTPVVYPISLPAGTFLSASGTMRARLPSGASAQRIMPSDMRPASLAGLRLVMTMTFLPTISSGV